MAYISRNSHYARNASDWQMVDAGVGFCWKMRHPLPAAYSTLLSRWVECPLHISKTVHPTKLNLTGKRRQQPNEKLSDNCYSSECLPSVLAFKPLTTTLLTQATGDANQH